MAAGGQPGGRTVRSGRRDEDGLPVVAELLDGFLDIGQRAVVTGLGRRLVVDPRDTSGGPVP